MLDSGWLTTSSKALQFEQNFAKQIGVKYACAVNSCTSALHLGAEALGIKQGSKVIVPALTFTSSAEILRYLGADPVFVDVDYGTGLVTPEIIKNAVRNNSDLKAAIIVHYGGQAPAMTTDDGEGVIDVCRKLGLGILEDAAHAFPTKYGNRYIGTFGDATCFSFYANKTITTGEGGMIVTDNEEIYKRVKIMRLHGINHDIWERYNSNNSSWEYDVVEPGFKYNMPDLNAAIGLAQLENAEYFRQQRQRCALFYYNELSNLKSIDLPVCSGPFENHSWHLFPIKIKPEAPVSRNDFIHLMASEGIGTSVHYKPLYRMKYYNQQYELNPDNFPNTEKIWKGTVSLPIYPDLNENELKYICNTIKNIL